MAESPDLLLLVQIGSGCLHPSNELHLLVVCQGIVPAQGHVHVGPSVQTVQFVRLTTNKNFQINSRGHQNINNSLRKCQIDQNFKCGLIL